MKSDDEESKLLEILQRIPGMLRGIDGRGLKMASERRTDYRISAVYLRSIWKGYFVQAAMGSPIIARECCFLHLMRSCPRGRDEAEVVTR